MKKRYHFLNRFDWNTCLFILMFYLFAFVLYGCAGNQETGNKDIKTDADITYNIHNNYADVHINPALGLESTTGDNNPDFKGGTQSFDFERLLTLPLSERGVAVAEMLENGAVLPQGAIDALKPVSEPQIEPAVPENTIRQVYTKDITQDQMKTIQPAYVFSKKAPEYNCEGPMTFTWSDGQKLVVEDPSHMFLANDGSWRKFQPGTWAAAAEITTMEVYAERVNISGSKPAYVDMTCDGLTP